MENVYGTWESSVRLLPRYMGALVKYNPGTIVEWNHLPRYKYELKVLNYVFWAFRPCIDGFEHCRKIISVDGTHLYTKYKHKMLIVVGLDANNQILPLAFAIFDEETYDSWKWFLELLCKYVVRGSTVQYFIDRITRRQHMIQSNQPWPDYAFRLYEKWSSRSSEHIVVRTEIRDQSASVVTGGRQGRGERVQVVTLSLNECSCGKWTTFGIPCSHSICTAKWYGLDPTQFIQRWFQMSEYVDTYEGRFRPIADEEYWDEPTFIVSQPE
ncbi:uncharacterized protein LOC142523707 [Primulina tabacum]|uniref:uncharacterized protein LOC142523707 n=1 Tax=Primulina tabacum TaxID=48773 RepID=UPI003F5A034C